MIDNWLLAPAQRCVKFLAEEAVYAGLLHRSLTTMSRMQPFLKLARKQLERKNQGTAALGALVAEYRSFEPMAKKHMDDGFSVIHSHSLVALWSVVESTLEDCVVLILEKAPDVADKMIKDAGYKVRGGPLEPMDDSARRRAYASLERQARKERRVGEGYVELLRAVGLEVRIEQDTLETISEVNAVRNCILHNGSIIDDRAASSISGLTGRVGEKICVDRETYLRYFDAMKEFAVSLLGAVTSSEYIMFVQNGG